MGPTNHLWHLPPRSSCLLRHLYIHVPHPFSKATQVHLVVDPRLSFLPSELRRAPRLYAIREAFVFWTENSLHGGVLGQHWAYNVLVACAPQHGVGDCVCGGAASGPVELYGELLPFRKADVGIHVKGGVVAGRELDQ